MDTDEEPSRRVVQSWWEEAEETEFFVTRGRAEEAQRARSVLLATRYPLLGSGVGGGG